jgi:hypothetical protein
MKKQLGDILLMAVDTDKLDYVREKLVEFGAPDQLVKDIDELGDLATNVIVDFDEIESLENCDAFHNVLNTILQEEENHG